jgi:phosphate starvation-inducible PhoH-like protein
LTEIIITPSVGNLVALFGPNDLHLNTIQKAFPETTIIARGNDLIIRGKTDDVAKVEQKFNLLINYFTNYGNVSEQFVTKILETELSVDKPITTDTEGSEIIVYGNNGLIVKARTPNQRKILMASSLNDMVFAIGPAGTGKTYTAVALAVRALKNKEVKKIILTRPAVEAGENLGFLPGDMKEKLDPYIQPLYDALRDMIPVEKLNQYLETGIIQIAPLAFMRGRTLDNAFVILDEAQNTTRNQLKMFLTRMGRSAKFIITGDVTQIDLPRNQPSGLVHATQILRNVKGIEFVQLDVGDVVRHRLVMDILKAYDKAHQNES